MKLKLLIAPLSVAFIIIFLIWYIYPVYTSPVDGSGIVEKTRELANKKEKISEIDKRAQNAASLASVLSSDKASSDLVFEYIPGSAKEEEIINGINSLASSNSLLVYNLSLNEEDISDSSKTAEDSSAGIIADGTVSQSQAMATDLTMMMSGETLSSPPSKADKRVISAKVSLIGDYGSMKNVLASLYRLNRFNQLDSISIKPLVDQENNVTGSLKADLIINFDYIKKSSSFTDGDIDNPVFLSGSFDSKAIDSIKSIRNNPIGQITGGQPGKDNPFAP
ncbi:MAG: hypothetical protein HGB08_04720 [Candidatus Moranbacteria bacterium]|nr:hypothetical protein [Candidatus Moranbacteria bacterium]